MNQRFNLSNASRAASLTSSSYSLFNTFSSQGAFSSIISVSWLAFALFEHHLYRKRF